MKADYFVLYAAEPSRLPPSEGGPIFTRGRIRLAAVPIIRRFATLQYRTRLRKQLAAAALRSVFALSRANCLFFVWLFQQSLKTNLRR